MPALAYLLALFILTPPALADTPFETLWKQSEEIHNSLYGLYHYSVDEHPQIIQEQFATTNHAAFGLAMKKFEWIPDEVMAYANDNFLVAEGAIFLNIMHTLCEYHRRYSWSFSKTDWQSSWQTKIRNKFELLKTRELRRFALTILLAKSIPEDKHLFLDDALSLGNDLPYDFAAAIRNKHTSILSMSSEQITQSKEIIAKLDKAYRARRERLFQITESSQALELLEAAVRKKDYAATSKLGYLSWKPAIKKNPELLLELIREMALSKEPHLANDKYAVLGNEEIFESPLKDQALEVWQNATIESTRSTDPAGRILYRLGNNIDASNIEFLKKLLESTDGEFKLIHVLKGMWLSPYYESTAKINEAFGDRLKERLTKLISSDDFSAGELREWLEIESYMLLRDYRQLLERAQWMRTMQKHPSLNERFDWRNLSFFETQTSKFFYEILQNKDELSSEELRSFAWVYLTRENNDYDSGSMDLEEEEQLEELVHQVFLDLPVDELQTLVNYFEPETLDNAFTLSQSLEEAWGSDPQKKALIPVYKLRILPPYDSSDTRSIHEIISDRLNRESFDDTIEDLKYLPRAWEAYFGEASKLDKGTAAMIILQHYHHLKGYGYITESRNDLNKNVVSLLDSPSAPLRTQTIEAIEWLDDPADHWQEPTLHHVHSCKLYCEGVRELALNMAEEGPRTPSWNRPQIFTSAIRTMKALTLVESSGLCEDVISENFSVLISEHFSRIHAAREPQSTSLARKASKIIAEQLLHIKKVVDRARLVDSAAIYELAYGLELVSKVHESAPTEELASLKRKLEKLNTRLLLEPLIDSTGGSGVNTFAYAVALHSMDSNKDLNRKELKILEYVDTLMSTAPTPQNLPYDPVPLHGRVSLESGGVDSIRGSVARAVGLHTALYQRDSRPSKKAEHRKNLIQALENFYEKYFYDLVAHLQRLGTHQGPDALAPYYLYPSLPFSSISLEMLLRDKELSEEDRVRVTKVAKTSRERILTLITENGSFLKTGGENQSRTSYVGFAAADQALGFRALRWHAGCPVELAE